MLKSFKTALRYIRGDLVDRSCCLAPGDSPTNLEEDCAHICLEKLSFNGGKLVIREVERGGPIRTTTRQTFQRNLSMREKSLIFITSSEQRQGFRHDSYPERKPFTERAGVAVLSEETLAAALSGDVTLCLANKTGVRVQGGSHNRLVNFPSFLCRVEIHHQAVEHQGENKIVGRIVVESKMKIREESLTLIDWEVCSETVQGIPDVPIYSYQVTEDLTSTTSPRLSEEPLLAPSVISPVHVYQTDLETNKVEQSFQLLKQKPVVLDAAKQSFSRSTHKKTSTTANPDVIAIVWGQNSRLAESTIINSRVAERMVNKRVKEPGGNDSDNSIKELVRNKSFDMDMKGSEETLDKVESGDKDRSGGESESVSEEETVISESDHIFTLENCTIEQFLRDEISCTQRLREKRTQFLKYQNSCVTLPTGHVFRTQSYVKSDLQPSAEQLDEVLSFINSEVSAIESLIPKPTLRS